MSKGRRTVRSRKTLAGSAPPRRRSNRKSTASRTALANPTPRKTGKNHFPIVGIGASAGGLEAFKQLLESLAPDTGMAFVFIQHLDPTHESMMVEILPHSTTMPVVEVRKGMAVEPDHVYVLPPAARATLVDGDFQLTPRPRPRGRELLIDLFFESLAETHKTRAIGVILSGTLSDGALGLKAIKAEGGITFAQDEATAKFHAMPHAAISLGSVDRVLSPEGIAQELERIARRLSGPGQLLEEDGGAEPEQQREELAEEPEDRQLSRIFHLLLKSSGVDFSAYRLSTIRRRIGRRMLVNRVETLEQYQRFLQEDPQEVRALYEDILITVTGFFRDPQSYEALKTTVFPAIVKDRPATNPIRVWVPGCATGEEVYSIAIALFEYLARSARSPAAPIQIFATDISETAIEKARAGVYLDSALAKVSPERLRRFFVPANGGHQVSKVIRDVCVFARQNVTADPPFSNLDLLSCRNLLIYLEPVLQKRILPVFHYALKPDGFLVLGKSETLGSFADLFQPVDRKNRIFRKVPGSATPRVSFGFHSGQSRGLAEMAAGGHEEPTPHLDPQKEADRIVLMRYSPPGVVVNDSLEILQFRGRTSPYLEPPHGAPSANVLKMARPGLLVELRGALLQARKSGARARVSRVRLRDDEGVREVDIEVVPLRGPGTTNHYLVLFEEAAPEAARAAAARRRRGPEAEKTAQREQSIVKLEQELTATKEYLQSLVEDQEASNEELKSANEEILSSNEELQSTNEELETAKEELESANEELTTVNEELANRNTQIERSNDDFGNLLSGIDTAILMLGPKGEIRRYTPAAEKLLKLRPADAGRPLKDLQPAFDLPDFSELLSQVIETITPIEREILSKEGRWHLVRIRPYRARGNRIEGTVVLVLDVDPLKRTVEQATRSRNYAEALVDTVRESLLVLDRKLRVRTANRAFYESFRVSPINTEGKLLFELGGEWGEAPRVFRTFLEDAFAGGESRNEEVEIDSQRMGHRTLVVNARPVRLPGEAETLLLLAIEDVTEMRQAAAEVSASEIRHRKLFETAREVIWLLDGESGEILDANPFTTEIFGYPRGELVGRRPWDLPLYEEPEEARIRFRETLREGFGFAPDVAMTTRDGREIHIEKVSSAYTLGSRTVVQSNMRDLTERRRLEDELRQSQKLESIGRLAGGIAHDFNNILNIISAYCALLAKGGDAARRAQSAEAIDKAVQRGAALVRQLLTFARREGTRFENVDLNALVRELASMISETFPKSIRIELDLVPALVPIRADPNQLHQALLNLCVNARDAMRDGGALKLTTAIASIDKLRTRFPVAREDRYVCVGVSDVGEGMDAATRSRIFEPFFSTKDAQNGSGLGLAVVYGIVNAHAGFIDVESEPAKGTAFSIYLPIRSPEEEKPEPEPEPEEAGAHPPSSGTILVVEDEEPLLDSMKALMESEGYRVLAAKDGVEAVELYRRHREEVAVVLADLGLPRLGGWEAFLEMKKMNPAVRAVFTSGTIESDQRAEMRKNGVEISVRKPFTETEMLGAVRRALCSPAGH